MGNRQHIFFNLLISQKKKKNPEEPFDALGLVEF